MKKFLLIVAISLFITTASAMSSTTGLTAGKASKPEAAAKGLYNAWKNNNRRAALQVASQSAVNKVFKTRYTGPGWQFNGCERRGASYNCFYYYEGGGVNMRVTGSSRSGYRVSSVSFVAD